MQANGDIVVGFRTDFINEQTIAVTASGKPMAVFNGEQKQEKGSALFQRTVGAVGEEQGPVTVRVSYTTVQGMRVGPTTLSLDGSFEGAYVTVIGECEWGGTWDVGLVESEK